MTLATLAEVTAWERAYDAAIAAGMQESAGTFADRKIVERRKRQGAPERCCAGCEAPIHGKSIDANDEEGVLATWHPECAPRNEKPSPPVARERLGEWDDGRAVSYRANAKRRARMAAYADGDWWVEGIGGKLKRGTATLGTFPTLLAAAQHAADSSAEARELYEWKGQGDDDLIACKECGQPWTSAHPVIQPEVGGPWVHLTCPPVAPPPDHIPQPQELVAPMSPAKEAATLLRARARKLEDGGGGFGTGAATEDAARRVAAEILESVAEDIEDMGDGKETFTDAARRKLWEADHIADAGKMVAPTRAEVEAERVKWDAASGPLDFWEWLGWTELESDDYEHRGTIPAHPLKVHAPTIDAVPTPVTDTLSPANGTRAPDAVRKAVEALVKCRHAHHDVADVTSDAGSHWVFCLACGARFSSGEWRCASLVAALIATK